MTIRIELDDNDPTEPEEEHGTFTPVPVGRFISGVVFTRRLGLVEDSDRVFVGDENDTGSVVKHIRLVEPATSPRLVVEVVVERPDGGKRSIEVPWHAISAIYWETRS